MHISALNITCYTVFELQIDTYTWHMAFISVSDISHSYFQFFCIWLISLLDSFPMGSMTIIFLKLGSNTCYNINIPLLNHMSIYFALPPMSSDYFPGIPNDMLQ